MKKANNLQFRNHTKNYIGLLCAFFSVDIMKKKLDPEGLGIVLLDGFMDEFFPHDPIRGPDTFTLYHYNGLSRPSSNTKIR